MERWIELELTRGDEDLLEQRARQAANPEAFFASRRRLADRVPDAVRPWLAHLAWLSDLLAAGCRFGVDELRPEEWRGVGMFRDAERRVGERYERCSGYGRPKLRSSASHACGWQRERDGR